MLARVDLTSDFAIFGLDVDACRRMMLIASMLITLRLGRVTELLEGRLQIAP